MTAGKSLVLPNATSVKLAVTVLKFKPGTAEYSCALAYAFAIAGVTEYRTDAVRSRVTAAIGIR